VIFTRSDVFRRIYLVCDSLPGFEESAVQVREDGGIPVGFPEAVSSFESLLPQALEGLEVGLEDLIEGAGAGIAGPVSGRRGWCGLGREPRGHGRTAHAE
jgi:hypothetical protein